MTVLPILFATIQLITARDHIEAGFLTPQTVYADADRIYLAGTWIEGLPPASIARGRLFVLARDRPNNFPTIEQIDNPVPLRAVCGDETRLYVADEAGSLLVYRKTRPLTLDHLQATGVAPSVLSMICRDDQLYLGGAEGKITADSERIYIAGVRSASNAVELDGSTFRRGLAIAGDAQSTVVYDRVTGNRLGSLPDPHNFQGALQWPVLQASGGFLYQTVPGCCGLGVDIYDANAMALRRSFFLPGANVIRTRGQTMIVGTEAGTVEAYDPGTNAVQFVGRADLRLLTGHNGVEDIEIRALWIDDRDTLIFAASSWGNDQSRSPLLPAFFVLDFAPVRSGADLKISGRESEDPSPPTGLLAHRFTITNRGPAEASNVAFRCSVSDNASVVMIEAGDATCTLQPPSCSFRHPIAAGGTADIIVGVAVQRTAVVTVRADVSSTMPDDDSDNNTIIYKTEVPRLGTRRHVVVR